MEETLNKAAKLFFIRCETDLDFVLRNSTGVLKERFSEIEKLIANNQKTFQSLRLTGKILIDATYDVVDSDQNIRNACKNIYNAYIDAARETEDGELLNDAIKMLNRMNFYRLDKSDQEKV